MFRCLTPSQTDFFFTDTNYTLLSLKWECHFSACIYSYDNTVQRDDEDRHCSDHDHDDDGDVSRSRGDSYRSNDDKWRW